MQPGTMPVPRDLPSPPRHSAPVSAGVAGWGRCRFVPALQAVASDEDGVSSADIGSTEAASGGAASQDRERNNAEQDPNGAAVSVGDARCDPTARDGVRDRGWGHPPGAIPQMPMIVPRLWISAVGSAIGLAVALAFVVARC